MLRLKGPVRAAHMVDSGDVVRVKRALADMNLYDTHGMEPNGALDGRLLGGVEAFQRRHGLTVDRMVAPGGETEQKMNEVLAAGKAGGAPAAGEPKAVQGPAFGLGSTVGKGKANRPDDVVAAKRGLAWAGFYPRDAAQKPTGAFDANLMHGLAGFQARHGLARDGWMGPGGETERTLDHAITPMIRAHGLPNAQPEHQDRPMLQPVQQPGEAEQAPAIDPSMTSLPSVPPVPSFPPNRVTTVVRPDAHAAANDPAYGALSPEQAQLYQDSLVNKWFEPWYKYEYLSDEHWQSWKEMIARRPDMSDRERRVYLEVFAAEGGFKFDPAGPAYAGLTPVAIEGVAEALGIDPETPPEQLSRQQVLEAYRQYFNQESTLGREGGVTALERLPYVGAAVALADLMFRRGGPGAATMLRDAMAQLDPAPQLPAEGGMIPELFELYVNIVSDPIMRGQLADQLEILRNRKWPSEPDRNSHMDWWLRGRLH